MKKLFYTLILLGGLSSIQARALPVDEKLEDLRDAYEQFNLAQRFMSMAHNAPKKFNVSDETKEKSLAVWEKYYQGYIEAALAYFD